MAIREEKEIRGIQIGKASLFADDWILYRENPKNTIRKLLALVGTKSHRIENQCTEITCTLIH